MENKRERVMKPMDENAKTSRERVAEGGSLLQLRKAN